MRVYAQSPGRWFARFLIGHDLAGGRSTDATFFHAGVTSVTPRAGVSRWALMSGSARVAVRLLTAPAGVGLALLYLTEPTLTKVAAGTALAEAVRRSVHAVRRRLGPGHRVQALYVRPLTSAVRAILGPATPFVVTVAPELAATRSKPGRRMSPAETAVRAWYGSRVAPVLAWGPERVRLAIWSVHARLTPVRNWFALFRKPAPTVPAAGVAIEVSRYVDDDQRKRIRAAVAGRTGLTELVEHWNQVGPITRATWLVPDRPPSAVGLAELVAAFERIAEYELYAGKTTGGRDVVLSLEDDSPHIACSAGSGAGKSVLAKLLALQILARGGKVLILDRKGSHRWARGLDGVTYCTRPADMSAALVGYAQLADDRNSQAMEEDEDWRPPDRRLVIFEEMNATVAQMRMWWENTREKGDPKVCPGITAFREIMFMGRSAWIHLFGVAQMLTSNTTGGPESRENFGIRALARYTNNNWKMLAPECPMPRKSKVRGRWQIVVAGEAVETQVCFLTDSEAHQFLGHVPASPRPRVPVSLGDQPGTPAGDTPADPLADALTLADAVAQGIFGNAPLDTVKKRRTRARAHGQGPTAIGMRGQSETYRRDDLIEWAESMKAEV